MGGIPSEVPLIALSECPAAKTYEAQGARSRYAYAGRGCAS